MAWSKSVIGMVALSLAPSLVPMAAAQPVADLEGGTVRNRHTIMLSAGYMGHAETNVSVGTVVLDNSGPAAWIGYTYAFDPDWAAQIELGWYGSSDVTVQAPTVVTESGNVVPILFGVRFQPEAWALGARTRPFLSALAGPYVGQSSGTRVAPPSVSASSDTQTAFGARFGGGIDVFLGRHFKLGGDFRYNAVTDFGQPVAGRDNYSGFEGVFVFGFVWGG